MKNILLFVVALSNFSSYGQKGFFLQPIGGIGVGSASYRDGYHFEYKTNFVLVYNANFCFGYQFDHLYIQTGVGYMRTGFKFKRNNIGNTTSSTAYYNHIVIPIGVGYRFNIGKKLSITPIAGVDITYNYSGRETEYTLTGVNWNKTMPMRDAYFKTYYRPYTGLGVIHVKFDYVLAQRLNFVCEPTINYMVSNMQNHQWVRPQYPSQHNYSTFLNMGIKYTFVKPHKEEKDMRQN